MRKTIRLLALAVAVAGIAVWLLTGAHRGWTKTSIEQRTRDEVTGLEAVSYEKGFVAGLDFLGAVLLGSVALVGVSWAFRDPPRTASKPPCTKP